MKLNITQLLRVSSADLDDARRRKLLNILAIGITPFSFLGILFTLYLDFFTNEPATAIQSLYVLSVTMFVGCLITILVNRFGSVYVAAIVFLVLITGVLVFGNDPALLITDYLFYLVVPILMASVILTPWASFIVAGVIGAIVIFIGMDLGGDFNLPALLGFLTIALVAWLSARSLESALTDLRVLNVELDQRVQDRTRELAEANEELSVAYERLKELDRLKSRFVSMVSHELRTPLSAIQGFAEMMEVGVYGAVTEKHQGALDRIKANTQRLLSLVNDLLDQARMEAGQLSLHIAPFSVKGLVNDMEATMRVLAEAKGLRLTATIEPNVPETVQGDAKRLHQIMVNLINNSLKFTKKGGVDVHIYTPDADHWTIDIIDTGPGIPEEARKLIFEPFRQVDNSATREHKGFGLGLAIVKQLSELMGGHVSVTSELGVGSTFSVVLPFDLPTTEKE